MSSTTPLISDGIIPIRVLIRARPLSKKEKNENAQECVRCYVEQNQVSCNDKMFAFDAVFDPSCSQDDVYLSSAGVLIDKIFAGYNCTILAYGQTGSGKTFTMGTEETTTTMLSESRGIVPRIVARIFECIQETEIPQAFKVTVSMLEIYDDKVIDLLTRTPSREGLQIREKDGAPFVQGLTSHPVSGLASTMKELETGCSLRSKGETAMNATSSRSHAVFTICVEKVAIPQDDREWQAKLRLVDLAGSERLKKTMAEGERKKEGIKINEGLHALGKVIQALSAEEKHIPYRDSKITRLLQDSLGGSSYTVMIACISPADSNGEETLSTLRYADRVKSIKNKPTVQLDPTQALIQKLRDENASLRLEVAAYRSGEVPDMIIPLSSIPPSMNIPSKAMPLSNAPPTASSTPMVGTPRRVVRREELDEREARALEKTVGVMKEKIAEMVMQKAKTSEQLIRAESQLEKLQEHLNNVESDIRMAVNSETPDAAFITLSTIIEKLDGEKVERDKEDEERQDGINDDSKMEDSCIDEGQDHEEEMNKALRNTESLEREMNEIMKEICAKEKLVSTTSAESAKLSILEAEHKKEMESLISRMNELQKERDTLQEQLKKISTTSKLSEERRKRLCEIEKDMIAQRKKLTELKNIEKMKKQSDDSVQKLKKEIIEMKQLRVRMTKQIREESDKYRQAKMIADKKIAQMNAKDRKREMETSRIKQTLGQQLIVVKRKYEEATTANKRLQQQLMRSKSCSIQRTMDEKTDELWKEHVHNELELVSSTYTAERSTDEMIKQRKSLSKTLKKLNDELDRLESGGPSKKHRRITILGNTSNDEEYKVRLLEEKRDCEEEIEKINATIQSLQSSSSNVNLANLAETRWSTVHTAAAAKLALKHLFEEAVGYIRASVDEKSARQEAEGKLKEKINKLKNDLEEKEDRYMTMLRSKELYQSNVNKEKQELHQRRGSLLQMVLSSDKITLSDEQMIQLRDMYDAIESMGGENTSKPNRTNRTRRTTTRTTISPPHDELMDGPRETKTINRFGDVRNTMEAVKIDEDDEVDVTTDDRDSTFRIGGNTTEEKKSKRRTNIKNETDDVPKKMTRHTSRTAVKPVHLRPSPIKMNESKSSRDDRNDEVNSTFVLPNEDDSPMTGDTTFVIDDDKTKENDKKRSGSYTVRSKKRNDKLKDEEEGSNVMMSLLEPTFKINSSNLGPMN